MVTFIKGKTSKDVGQSGMQAGDQVIPGCPIRAQRVSVGHPGITSECSWLSHI